MEQLEMIKRHVDDHGVGCVVMSDHVAITTVWVSRAVDGEERHKEIIRRVTSLHEACGVLGCHCDEANSGEVADCAA